MRLSYILKRIILVALNVLFATLITFIMIRLTPGDPAELIVKKVFIGTEEYQGSTEELVKISEKFGLGRPMAEQYLDWLRKAVRFDLGYSYITGFKVSEELALRCWPTISLALCALGFSIVLTIILGMLYNLFQNGMFRGVIDACIISFIAVPNFYLALILIMIFSIKFDVLPVSGYGSLNHYILPVATLGLTIFGYTTKILNTSIAQVMNQEFIVTARAKGLARLSIFKRHVLRNSLIPVVPYAALQLGYMLGGVVVIETVFSLPGIGKYLVDSIQAKDLPAIQACVLFIALTFSAANLLADVILFILDPRIHYRT